MGKKSAHVPFTWRNWYLSGTEKVLEGIQQRFGIRTGKVRGQIKEIRDKLALRKPRKVRKGGKRAS